MDRELGSGMSSSIWDIFEDDERQPTSCAVSKPCHECHSPAFETDVGDGNYYCDACFKEYEAAHPQELAPKCASNVTGDREDALEGKETCIYCGASEGLRFDDGELVCSECRPVAMRDSSDDEETGCSDAAKHRAVQNIGSAKHRELDRNARLELPSEAAWSAVLSEATLAALEKLPKADANLFKVMVAHGWNSSFVLLPHQPAAVRFVAGVNVQWPQQYPPTEYPCGNPNGGGILADGMGLGKTVEGIGGIFVREILALHNKVPAERRVSLIVTPNNQVMEQWYEHLIKVGVPEAAIGTYSGDRQRKHGILRHRSENAEEMHLTPPRCASTVALLTSHGGLRARATHLSLPDVRQWKCHQEEPRTVAS